MILRRREFLKLLGLTAGALGAGGCARDWLVPDGLVEAALRGPGIETWQNTVCGLCEGRCGLSVRLVDGLPVGLKGSPAHPLNRGGLCPVGHAGLDLLYSPERLRQPLRRDGRTLRATSWDEALDEIAARLGALRDAGRGHRVALLSGEPDELFHQLARRFGHALGSPHVARTGGADAVAFTLAQGAGEAPGFDLSHADLVLSFGLDLYEDGPAPMHAVAAMIGSREPGRTAALIHAGTRRSLSAAKAERFLAVRPGTHGALALGIGHVLVREGSYDRRFVAENTFGFDDWTDEDGRSRPGFRRLLLERYYPDRAASLCGVEATRIIAAARRFASAAAPVAVAGGEAVQGSNGVATAMAVHALNALAGRFDRPGGVVSVPPIALTPLDPLPGEPGEEEPDRPAAGDPVETLARRVEEDPEAVEVLIVAEGDPVHDSPSGDRLRRAMETIPLVVALSPFPTDTTAAADLVLPSHLFLEAWGASSTPPGVPFGVLGLAHPVVEPLGDTRHPGDVLLALARRTGGPAADALPWADYPAYLRHRVEGLVRSGQGTVISGSFQESWVRFLEERGWRFLEQSAPEDFWESLEREGGWWNPVDPREQRAGMPTPSGRYELASRGLERRLRTVGAAADADQADDPLAAGIASLGLAAEPDEVLLPHFEPPRTAGEGELVLVPIRPTTARSTLGPASRMVAEMYGYPHLSGWETWAELAPETAHELDVHDGDRVALRSGRGEIEATVRLVEGSSPGVVHVPLGLGRRGGASAGGGLGANPLEIVEPVPDPLSGAPALAATRVRLELIERRDHGAPAPGHGGRPEQTGEAETKPGEVA